MCYNGSMKATDIIYKELTKGKELRAEELAELEGVGSRTYVSRLLAEMIEEGKVASRKEGRNVYYFATSEVVLFEKSVRLKNLHEEEIWGETKRNERFPVEITDEAETIAQFAFTEMLNNAIDHSKSGVANVKIWIENGIFKFIVRDFGIGVFRSVMRKVKTDDEIEALREILKGKLTTDPKHHSGEGIFWTTKIADKVVFESFGVRLTVDNTIDDYAIEKLDEKLIGTKVYFEIRMNSKKSMSELFHKYSFDNEKLLLDTTAVPIKLYDGGETWISRSQAKKVLNGLDKFKKITFDFSGVSLIGQGFADEIFRVYQIEHPEIVLEAVNMNETVRLMVEHARNDGTGR